MMRFRLRSLVIHKMNDEMLQPYRNYLERLGFAGKVTSTVEITIPVLNL